ncbi:MAG TPA: DUF5700 domain-containing putative Zn-dependent protease [Sphingobacteriaceae bacterium]|nr:DUF5700 domain-containing putative Zn-dependent protease [Sphingobacteriaceae bacterium]
MKNLFFIIAIVLTSFHSYGQVNTDAIESYFKITDSLKAGKKISEDAWNSFFKIEGNAFFLKKTARNSSELMQTFKGKVNQVYNSSDASQLNPGLDLVLRDIIYVKTHETSIKNFVKSFAKGYLIDSMYQESYKYLPKRLQTRVKNLNLVLSAPLAPNASAENETIYTNVAIEHRFYKIKPGAVSTHELHHLLLKRQKFKNPILKHEFHIVFVLSLISREGIADLIDKKYLAQFDDTTYNGLLNKSLVQSDKLVLNISLEIEKLRSNVNQRPNFKLSSGHTPGYFMARIIERNGYLNELIEGIDNPFNFIYIYNKAAKKDKGKPTIFADGTIEFLKEIDKRLFN